MGQSPTAIERPYFLPPPHGLAHELQGQSANGYGCVQQNKIHFDEKKVNTLQELGPKF